MLTAIWCNKIKAQEGMGWSIKFICASAGLILCASSVAAETTVTAVKKPVSAAAIKVPAASTSTELLSYLISSGALTVDDAQKLVDKLRLDEQKKKSENLLNYLVESKSISLPDAQKLLNDLRSAKGKEIKPEAADKVPLAPLSVPASSAVVVNEAVAADEKKVKPASAEAESAPANRIHAVYLPDTERARIRDEIKQEILATARKENWAQPDIVPEWVRRIHVSGDLLLRGQGEYMDRSNDPAINFQAINAGAPVDIFLPSSSNSQKVLTIPYLNTTEDRSFLKLRARIQLLADVADKVDVGLRLTTGNASTPVSSTQTLGNDFNKFNVLLDRAWLRYRPLSSVMIIGGRMANPWLAPTELVWDKDVGFDGLAMQYKVNVGDSSHLFATGGAFVTGSTDANYPSLSPFKSASNDKWLFGLQLGGDTQTRSGFGLRSSVGYYEFDNIEGRLSASCFAPTDKVPCETDNTRPGFSQKGNTMFALRLPYRPQPGSDPEFQYFGLASQFRVLNMGIGFDFPVRDAVHAQFDFDVARNLAFDEKEINSKNPVNNFSTCPATNPGCNAKWVGGGDAWQTQLRLGYSKISEAGQWNSVFGYKNVESDALVDAYTDSDFHLGGTNAKGYFAGAGLGFAHNAWVSAKYMSATEVSGWKYSADLFQLDLNSRF